LNESDILGMRMVQGTKVSNPEETPMPVITYRRVTLTDEEVDRRWCINPPIPVTLAAAL
jgi:hypothetical protein